MSEAATSGMVTAESAAHEEVHGHTPRQRWYIAASVSVLVAIMVGVAFAAGVYIGNNRELAPGALPGGPGGGPVNPAPGQLPQRFGQPQGAVPAVPGGVGPGQAVGPGQVVIPGAANGGPANANQAGRPYDLIASVSTVSGNVLRLITPDGPREFPLDPQVRIASDTGQVLGRPALRPATVVALLLRPNGEGVESITILGGLRNSVPLQPAGN